MPELEINLDALAHNLRLIRRQEQAWGFRFLPVLKMVASHPDVVDFLRTQGYARYGIADMTEHLLYGQEPPARTGRVLINLAPPDRADDVVRLFERSAFSCESTFRALDAAARAAGLHHEALLMVDIGDMREGIPQEDAPALLRAVATASQRAAHGPGAHVAGIGVNLGCLYGTCPDDENMALLEALAARAGALLGHALHRVSLGGSIFWNWFARRHGHGPHLPPGCIMEFRMGDPLLLGRDMYRDEALLAGDFRQDIFRLSATVLEVTERDIRPPRQSVHNGRGLHADCPDLGKRLRALVDCGSLHTDVRGLSLARPDWRISDFSGNYAILDLSGCPQAPVPGEHVRFIPSYWAVARTCRMPHIRKTLIHDTLPGQSLPDSRPASPQQETAPLSEVS